MIAAAMASVMPGSAWSMSLVAVFRFSLPASGTKPYSNSGLSFQTGASNQNALSATRTRSLSSSSSSGISPASAVLSSARTYSAAERSV